MAKLDPRTSNINGIGHNVGWKLHFEPINNNPETFEAIQSHLRDTAKVDFKGGTSGYGNLASEGKTYTAYPRSLEERDRVIASMHHKDTGISHLLAPVKPIEGNAQFTDNITGRFSTGYTYADPLTGEIDWGRGDGIGAENRASVTAGRRGEVNNYIKDSWNSPYETSELPSFLTETDKRGFRVSHEQIAEDIASLKTNHPDVHELMVGKPGYNSPYPVHLPGVNSAAAKKPLIQPEVADFLPKKMINGRPVVKLSYEKMSVEELLDSRAKTYWELLDPEYGNGAVGSYGAGGFHVIDRASITGMEAELIKRGEDISMLPEIPAHDPGYVAGSGKRAPYLRSKEPIASTPTPKSLGAPSLARVSTSSESAPIKIGSPTEIRTSVGAPTRMPIQKATTATEARIASSVAVETVEEGIGKVVQRSGSSSRLLGAAAEASAAVAGGSGKSGLLRATAAAATILGVADISRRRHNNPYKKE